MKWLLVSATWEEIAPFAGKYGLRPPASGHGWIPNPAPGGPDVLITRPGMLFTAWELGLLLTRRYYPFMLQAGMAGSYTQDMPPGSVVRVDSEILADLGAENHEDFLDMFDLQLLSEGEFPFTGRVLESTATGRNSLLGKLPAARSLTVNTVHGRKTSIAAVRKRFSPDIENMEGAAFFLAGLESNTPFEEIRAVSNYVEPRDKTRWQLKKAVENLNRIIEDFNSELASGTLNLKKYRT